MAPETYGVMFYSDIYLYLTTNQPTTYIQEKLKNQVDILHELLVRLLKNFDPIVRLETSPPV